MTATACALSLSVAVAGAAPLAAASRPGAAAGCVASGGLHFVCGADRPEDLARVPGTRWLIASGFSDGAGLKLIDSRAKRWRFWYTGAAPQSHPDWARFGDCKAPPDPTVFNTQGLSLKAAAGGGYDLYVVNHGGRESVEVFAVDAAPDEPTLRWQGCVRMPAGLAANSVAAFADGTILATVLTRPGTTIADFVRGRKTGAVYAWSPAQPAFHLIAGTQLPGNNGLEISQDQKSFYVIAFGWHCVVRYSRTRPARPLRLRVAPGFMPDNIHWDGARLIAAGMRYNEPACGGLRKVINGKADDMRCHRGYVVAQVDPQTLAYKVLADAAPDPYFNGVSAAVIIDDTLWLASYQADRLAYRSLPSSDPRKGAP